MHNILCIHAVEARHSAPIPDRVIVSARCPQPPNDRCSTPLHPVSLPGRILQMPWYIGSSAEKKAVARLRGLMIGTPTFGMFE